MANEVRIYTDPITQEDFEGSAKVLKVYQRDDTTSFCKVRFLSGPHPRVVGRWVDNDQLQAAKILTPSQISGG